MYFEQHIFMLFYFHVMLLSLSLSIFLNIEKRRRSASFHAQGNNKIQTKTTLQLKRIQQTNKANLSQ